MKSIRNFACPYFPYRRVSTYCTTHSRAHITTHTPGNDRMCVPPPRTHALVTERYYDLCSCITISVAASRRCRVHMCHRSFIFCRTFIRQCACACVCSTTYLIVRATGIVFFSRNEILKFNFPAGRGCRN